MREIMKFRNNILLLLLVSMTVISCSSDSTGPGNGDNDGDGGDGGGNETVTYSLSTTISPVNSGSVAPASGTFDEGSQVQVEATPANGYTFTEWTGDVSSTDNPLSFSIDDDTELTANFKAVSSSYIVSLELSDADNSMSDLSFGQWPDASDEADERDLDSPPPPPEDALHGYFKTNGRELFKDIRNAESTPQSWNLQIQVGTGAEITLSWAIDAEYLLGTLILKNADSSVEVDMTAQTEITLPSATADSVMIEYQLSN